MLPNFMISGPGPGGGRRVGTSPLPRHDPPSSLSAGGTRMQGIDGQNAVRNRATVRLWRGKEERRGVLQPRCGVVGWVGVVGVWGGGGGGGGGGDGGWGWGWGWWCGVVGLVVVGHRVGEGAAPRVADHEGLLRHRYSPEAGRGGGAVILRPSAAPWQHRGCDGKGFPLCGTARGHQKGHCSWAVRGEDAFKWLEQRTRKEGE